MNNDRAASAPQTPTQKQLDSESTLATCIKVLMKIRKETGNPELPLQQVLALLLIAGRHETPLVDLESQLDLEQPSVSRTVKKLGKGWPHKEPPVPGYGLVESYPDPTYEKRSLARLTPAGERLIRSLLK